MSRPPSEVLPLTSLRAFAAGWVVLHHFQDLTPTGWFSWGPAAPMGYLGVDVFFILSGYVMAHVHGHNCQAGRFLALRLARMYPLHLTMLLVYGVFAWASGYMAQWPLRFTGDSLVAQLSLTVAWVWQDHASWNVPAWSISAEWFAYLCFPVIVGAWRTLPPRSAAIVALVCWLGLTSVPALGAHGNMNEITTFALLRVSFEFLIGMSLRRLADDPAVAAAPWDAIAGAAIIAVATIVWAGGPDILAIGPFAVIVMACHMARGPFRAFMSARAFVHLGHTSYSVYMIHYVVLLGLGFAAPHLPGSPLLWIAASVAVILTAAELAWRLIEEPARKAARAWLDRGLRPRAESGSFGPLAPARSRAARVDQER